LLRSVAKLACSSALSLRPALLLGRGADRRRGFPLLGLALDDDLPDLAGLEQPAVDELLDQRPVLLLVLVRQRVLVGAQRDDDVLLARRRVAAQADGHLGHANTSSISRLNFRFGAARLLRLVLARHFAERLGVDGLLLDQQIAQPFEDGPVLLEDRGGSL